MQAFMIQILDTKLQKPRQEQPPTFTKQTWTIQCLNLTRKTALFYLKRENLKIWL